jgi:hypothetical protein
MRAIVTIIDEETGEEIVKDKLIRPSVVDMDYDTMIKTYAFAFKIQRLDKEMKK